jgi:hypothetical protein
MLKVPAWGRVFSMTARILPPQNVCLVYGGFEGLRTLRASATTLSASVTVRTIGTEKLTSGPQWSPAKTTMLWIAIVTVLCARD